MDELDIYDDLDEFHEKEERKSKELLALEEKYNEALKTIEALHLEKKDLRKKIRIMEKNLQSLLDTAKMEIKRKDKQIAELHREKEDICFRRQHIQNKRNIFSKQQTYDTQQLESKNIGNFSNVKRIMQDTDDNITFISKVIDIEDTNNRNDRNHSSNPFREKIDDDYKDKKIVSPNIHDKLKSFKKSDPDEKDESRYKRKRSEDADYDSHRSTSNSKNRKRLNSKSSKDYDEDGVSKYTRNNVSTKSRYSREKDRQSPSKNLKYDTKPHGESSSRHNRKTERRDNLEDITKLNKDNKHRKNSSHKYGEQYHSKYKNYRENVKSNKSSYSRGGDNKNDDDFQKTHNHGPVEEEHSNNNNFCQTMGLKNFVESDYLRNDNGRIKKNDNDTCKESIKKAENGTDIKETNNDSVLKSDKIISKNFSDENNDLKNRCSLSPLNECKNRDNIIYNEFYVDKKLYRTQTEKRSMSSRYLSKDRVSTNTLCNSENEVKIEPELKRSKPSEDYSHGKHDEENNNLELDDSNVYSKLSSTFLKEDIAKASSKNIDLIRVSTENESTEQHCSNLLNNTEKDLIECENISSETLLNACTDIKEISLQNSPPNLNNINEINNTLPGRINDIGKNGDNVFDAFQNKEKENLGILNIVSLGAELPKIHGLSDIDVISLQTINTSPQTFDNRSHFPNNHVSNVSNDNKMSSRAVTSTKNIDVNDIESVTNINTQNTKVTKLITQNQQDMQEKVESKIDAKECIIIPDTLEKKFFEKTSNISAGKMLIVDELTDSNSINYSTQISNNLRNNKKSQNEEICSSQQNDDRLLKTGIINELQREKIFFEEKERSLLVGNDCNADGNSIFNLTISSDDDYEEQNLITNVKSNNHQKPKIEILENIRLPMLFEPITKFMEKADNCTLKEKISEIRELGEQKIVTAVQSKHEATLDYIVVDTAGNANLFEVTDLKTKSQTTGLIEKAIETDCFTRKVSKTNEFLFEVKQHENEEKKTQIDFNMLDVAAGTQAIEFENKVKGIDLEEISIESECLLKDLPNLPNSLKLEYQEKTTVLKDGRMDPDCIRKEVQSENIRNEPKLPTNEIKQIATEFSQLRNEASQLKDLQNSRQEVQQLTSEGKHIRNECQQFENKIDQFQNESQEYRVELRNDSEQQLKIQSLKHTSESKKSLKEIKELRGTSKQLGIEHNLSKTELQQFGIEPQHSKNEFQQLINEISEFKNEVKHIRNKDKKPRSETENSRNNFQQIRNEHYFNEGKQPQNDGKQSRNEAKQIQNEGKQPRRQSQQHRNQSQVSSNDSGKQRNVDKQSGIKVKSNDLKKVKIESEHLKKEESLKTANRVKHIESEAKYFRTATETIALKEKTVKPSCLSRKTQQLEEILERTNEKSERLIENYSVFGTAKRFDIDNKHISNNTDTVDSIEKYIDSLTMKESLKETSYQAKQQRRETKYTKCEEKDNFLKEQIIKPVSFSGTKLTKVSLTESLELENKTEDIGLKSKHGEEFVDFNKKSTNDNSYEGEHPKNDIESIIFNESIINPNSTGEEKSINVYTTKNLKFKRNKESITLEENNTQLNSLTMGKPVPADTNNIVESQNKSITEIKIFKALGLENEIIMGSKSLNSSESDNEPNITAESTNSSTMIKSSLEEDAKGSYILTNSSREKSLTHHVEQYSLNPSSSKKNNIDLLKDAMNLREGLINLQEASTSSVDEIASIKSDKGKQNLTLLNLDYKQKIEAEIAKEQLRALENSTDGNKYCKKIFKNDTGKYQKSTSKSSNQKITKKIKSFIKLDITKGNKRKERLRKLIENNDPNQKKEDGLYELNNGQEIKDKNTMSIRDAVELKSNKIKDETEIFRKKKNKINNNKNEMFEMNSNRNQSKNETSEDKQLKSITYPCTPTKIEFNQDIDLTKSFASFGDELPENANEILNVTPAKSKTPLLLSDSCSNQYFHSSAEVKAMLTSGESPLLAHDTVVYNNSIIITPTTSACADSRYDDLDRNMQKMFQSPAKTNTFFTPTPNGNLNALLDTTIDETVNNNTLSMLNGSSASASLDSSMETKRLSLGSSQYVIERVSENVVNLMITRRNKKKRRNKFVVGQTSNISQ